MATEDTAHPGGGDAADEVVTVTELVDSDTGRWQVATETSLYILDLDMRTMLRVPGAGMGVQRDPVRGPVGVTSLAADHRAVPLEQLVYCQLGRSMYLLTEPWSDGTVMVRGTTVVHDIRRLPHRNAAPAPRRP